MRAVQVPQAGGDFELVERDLPEPGEGEVRVTVQACGVCHSDMFAKEGVMGDATPFPIVPGHEIVGVVDALGDGVRGDWKPGDRVGVGCFVEASSHPVLTMAVEQTVDALDAADRVRAVGSLRRGEGGPERENGKKACAHTPQYARTPSRDPPTARRAAVTRARPSAGRR